MPARMFDFDLPTDRRGTGSYKWDELPGAVPMWVADMDFRTAPCVIEALRRRTDHGIFGYTLVTDAYYEALAGWFAGRHGFSFGRGDVIYTSGVVPALSAIVKALALPGEGVIVQTPVYNCFFSSIRNNGCRVVENKLLRRECAGGEFTYRMDFGGLEELCSDPANTMLILCNPANPAGRLWQRQELETLRDIARRHRVAVVSDEIHCELTPPGVSYTPYGTVDPDAIVCLSPSKAFNTAGLQIANIVCRDAVRRAMIDRAININEVCDVNPFGVEALKASYSAEGREWLDALRAYLHANWELTRGTLRRRLPACPLCRLEATYLVWLDVSALMEKHPDIPGLLVSEAGVRVSPGEMYGDARYIRLNIATQRDRLEAALNAVCNTLGKL